MKKFIFTIFFVLFYFKSSIVMGAEDLKALCRKHIIEPKVSIVAQIGDLKYDHTKSKKAITRMHLSTGADLITGELLQGLSLFERKLSVGVKVESKRLPSGINCYYPKEVNFKIGTGENPTIFIAREIKRGTCKYDVVLRHEQTHQQINQSVIEHYVPVIKEKLREIIQKYPVAATRKNIDINVVADDLSAKYTKSFTLLLEEINQATQKEQSKLDNLEQYTYESDICR